ncbi:MAG: hypothetical protein Phog2KO_32860 [Phototrophicaceae bacterium]
MTYDYDAIIVGGRVAGSHLAARLAKYGFNVLLLERDEFPSLPAVSSPIIFSATMQLLDEIRADENEYAKNTPPLRQMMAVAGGEEIAIALPEYQGRDYAYAIDRARFDASLWDTAMRYETVVGRQNFSVTDLIWENERVIGVVGKEKGGAEETFTAKTVIGADGRFGIVGRKVNVSKIDIHDEHPTSIYYAYWRNVAQVNNTPSAITYEAKNYTYLTMDSADGETVITIEGRADSLDPQAGKIESFYLSLLEENPYLQARMQNAEMVTSVRGMKNIGNSYHQAGGAGWALVGDAYHQKDPADGQGMYNAVITGKALARQMLRWKNGEVSWDEAIKEYDTVARIKTYAMYKSLQTRIKTSFYSEGNPPIPAWAQKNLSRWVLDDEEFMTLAGKFITRELPADYVTLMATPTLIGAVARGFRKDVEKRIKKRLPFLG